MKWNTLLYSLLFSGLGVFSFLLLANYTELPDKVVEVLYSTGGFLFFILAFNLLGYSTLRISSWLNNQYALNYQRKWRIIIVYTAVMLSFLLLNYGMLVAAKFLAGTMSPFSFQTGGIRILLVVWLVELVILGLLLANRSMQNTLKLQRKAVSLQKENDIARYTALQNQLNPHFLFNSLNTLIAEIEYNPQNAISFTKNLSNVYRYVLQCQDKTLISLGEELEFMTAYLFLHEVRLGDCLRWNLQIPVEKMDYMLPPLTLQLLVENVIKHNSITMSKPMEIDVKEESDYLVVSNPIHPRKSGETTNIGLKNLSNRCKLIQGKEIEITKLENQFIVKIPLSYE